MYYVSEQAVRQSVSQADVTAGVAAAFVAMGSGRATNFPVVRETLNYANAIFGFKSGFNRNGPVLGVKAGGLWPGNRERGLANHQSTIVLFDPDSGSPHALVRGTFLTALRTAAASALSIRFLARDDARTLGILGAGGQSEFQVRAAIAERAFERVVISDLDDARAAATADALSDTGLTVDVCSPRAMAEAADVLITVTPSTQAVIEAGWVRAGTHLACMGADTRGKQEVATELLSSATVFGDEPGQAVTIGECQHAALSGLIAEGDVRRIGTVIAGTHPGRQSADEITLFDSTGVGLQDLAAATVALKQCRRSGLAIELD